MSVLQQDCGKSLVLCFLVSERYSNIRPMQSQVEKNVSFCYIVTTERFVCDQSIVCLLKGHKHS